ncbi:MAG: N,N-dimethylformamidase beta subunit family domain-containing protein [Acidimicrobiales bacterium]
MILTIGLVIVLAAATGIVVATSGGTARPKRPPVRSDASRSSGHKKHSTKGSGGNRISLGTYGVESSAIAAQNQLPGTTTWKLSGAPATGSIAGFANTTYASAGQQVVLYVSTTAPQFRVVAYRMGYYQGKGGRQIWSSPEVPGKVQPTCPVTAGINMVSCDNWTPSLTMTVTASFMQGDYLLKLVGSGNQQSYVLLTVWNPAGTAAYLVMSRSLTEEGWNTYGGYSYYQGQGPCTLGQTGSYPPCNRARVVSFDRPFATGQGASDFLGNEYPLVRFMEKHGLDVAYCTDITVDEHPTILLHHRVLLSLGHDETWTTTERQAAQTALAHGMNLAFMGAAPMVRHSRLQPSPLGPDREEVDYRNSTEDPLNGTGHTATVTGNTFATPPTNDPPTGLVGGEYSGYMDPGASPLPLVVHQATSWLFRGTGLKQGTSVSGVVASDIQHVNPTSAPTDLQVLAHSPVPLSEAYTNQGSWGGNTYADTTYFTQPSGNGGVFQSGTVNWINALNPCLANGGSCANAMLQKITGNLLWLFGQGPAGSLDPPVSNVSGVTPPGS